MSLFRAITAALITIACLASISVAAEYEPDKVLSFPRTLGRKQTITATQLPQDRTDLHMVQISNAVLDEGCIRFIAQQVELRAIVLEDVNLTDRDLAFILANVECEFINVMGASITDAAIPMLVKHRSLKQLYVRNTGVTREGTKKLKALRGDVEVDTPAP